jgi:hypothetical protein
METTEQSYTPHQTKQKDWEKNHKRLSAKYTNLISNKTSEAFHPYLHSDNGQLDSSHRWEFFQNSHQPVVSITDKT